MKYLINVPIASLYNIPRAGSELSDEALYGMECDVVESAEEYCKIKTFYGYEGYVLSSALSEATTPPGVQTTVVKPFCDVLDAPKVQGGCLITLPRGAFIYKTGVADGDYSAVKLYDGRSGFAKSSALAERVISCDTKNEPSLRDRLVESAEKYLGAQYRWGGKTPLGIDCSGLCSMAYMLNGIIIWRDAKLAEGYPLKPIAYEELKRGDLVFAPGHVMMYIGGDRIIHSTSLCNGVVYGVLPDKDKTTGAGSIF